MTNKNITIVINTFKSEDKIFNCLNSIDSSYQIIVIENSSNNMLKNQIEQKYSNVQCFLTGENLDGDGHGALDRGL